jgi:hypothetical protein
MRVPAVLPSRLTEPAPAAAADGLQREVVRALVIGSVIRSATARSQAAKAGVPGPGVLPAAALPKSSVASAYMAVFCQSQNCQMQVVYAKAARFCRNSQPLVQMEQWNFLFDAAGPVYFRAVNSNEKQYGWPLFYQAFME